MPYCPICERRFDTKNGLQGHFRFKHKYEVRQGKPARETLLTRAIGKDIERRVSGDAVMKAMEAMEEKESSEDVEREAEGSEGISLKGLIDSRWLKGEGGINEE